MNAARGDQIATQDEIWQAHQDNLSDAWDGDFNDDGFLDSWKFLF